MGHWCEQYVGLPYVEGDRDCASLTEQVQREQFGRQLCLPTARANNYRGWSRQIAQCRDDFVQQTDDPVDGDLVLMFGRGHLNHLGTLLIIESEFYVLHAQRSAGQVCLHRLSRLEALTGLKVEGFYSWRR